MHRVSYEASRQRARVDDHRRHLNRVRRRVDPLRRELRAHRGRLVLRAHDGAQHAVRGRLSRPTRATSPRRRNTLDAWVERVHRAGIQLNCHANGDVAIDMTLTAYERAQKLFPRADARPKITHCTLINDALIRRMKALGVVPAPFTSYAYYNSDKFKYYGEELMKRCMAYRTFIDTGIVGGGGVGLQPGPVRPAHGDPGDGHAARLERRDLGRQPADQRGRGARRSIRSTAPGTRTRKRSRDRSRPGKLADFVIMADDMHTIDRREDQGHPDRAHGGRRGDDASGVAPEHRPPTATSRAVSRQAEGTNARPCW